MRKLSSGGVDTIKMNPHHIRCCPSAIGRCRICATVMRAKEFSIPFVPFWFYKWHTQTTPVQMMLPTSSMFKLSLTWGTNKGIALLDNIVILFLANRIVGKISRYHFCFFVDFCEKKSNFIAVFQDAWFRLEVRTSLKLVFFQEVQCVF